MSGDRTTPMNIDEYILGFPPELRAILQNIRVTIKEAAPDAVEKISYKMPTFAFKRGSVHFGAFKKHIGLYPPVRDEKLRKKAAPYAGEKGNLQFPLDKPIPYDLISEIVRVHVSQRREGPG
jgi:uncharacterized protein YdhG (YjbR/CyaY superfamily)